MSSHSPGRAPCVPSPNVLLMSSWSCQPRSLLPGLRKLSLLAGMVLGTRGCPGDLSRGGQHQALPGGDGHHLQSSREGAWEPRVGRGGGQESPVIKLPLCSAGSSPNIPKMGEDGSGGWKTLRSLGALSEQGPRSVGGGWRMDEGQLPASHILTPGFDLRQSRFCPSKSSDF